MGTLAMGLVCIAVGAVACPPVVPTGVKSCPVAPKDLPPQYKRLDTRIPTEYHRTIRHKCSYPNDPFSCADISGDQEGRLWQCKAVTFSQLRLKVAFLGLSSAQLQALWNSLEKVVIHPWGQYKKGNVQLPGSKNGFGACGRCALTKWFATDGSYPSLASSFTYFCSESTVDGKWLMKRAFYTDEACQDYLALDKDDVTFPLGDSPSFRNDTSCQSIDFRCSSTLPMSYCTTDVPGVLTCPLEGSKNRKACDAFKNFDPYECGWHDGQEFFTAQQHYQTLEETGTHPVVV